MPKKIVLSGYYGFKNAGDDAVCYAILKSLETLLPDAEVTVLSNDPALTQATYGVRAVNRWQPTDVLPTIAASDLMISGGGSLLQDVTSRDGILYYLGILEAARRFHVPYVIYAQGVGPVLNKRNQRLVARAANGAAAVTVRDPESRRFVESIGVQKPVLIAPDPVLGLAPEKVDREKGRRILTRAGWRGEKPLVVVAVRQWENIDRVEVYATALDRIAADGYDIALVAMQPSAEAALCQAVAGHMHGRAYVLTEEYGTDALLAIFAQAHLVIGMRLHALVMGAVCGTRLLALPYDPKVTAFMRLIHEPHISALEGLDSDALVTGARLALADAPPDAARIKLLGDFARVPAEICRKILAE